MEYKKNIVNVKVFSFSKLVKVITDHKRKKKRIILCHGVFDLMHIGHIKYFQEAKAMGDVLVVTITPDRFVNKGPNRPVFNENLRAEAIAALGMVDYISINEWSSAIETIKALKPDLYVKGPDYKDYSQDLTGNILLEENAVKSVGGEIAFTSDITFSSSAIINQHISKFSNEQQQYIDDLRIKYKFNDIVKYFDSLTKLKVLLVGEVIIDEYVFCNTMGKSGKEPVLVSQKINVEKYAGGILSVANQISDFCKEGKILSYLGERDDQNEFINQNLSSNIDLDFIIKSNSPTILKTRFIDNYTKTKSLGVYDINDNLLEKHEEEEFYTKIDDIIDQYDVVITVDYGHGLLTPKIINQIENKSKYLALNTQMNSFNIGHHTISKYSDVNYVCVHEGELRNDYRDHNNNIENLTKSLSKRINAEVIVITQGNEGSLVYDNNSFTNCPAFADKVVDRIGAGDTLLAITSLCFAVGMPKDLTLLIGNLAAAEMVATIGTGMKLSKINILKSIETLLK